MSKNWNPNQGFPSPEQVERMVAAGLASVHLHARDLARTTFDFLRRKGTSRGAVGRLALGHFFSAASAASMPQRLTTLR